MIENFVKYAQIACVSMIHASLPTARFIRESSIPLFSFNNKVGFSCHFYCIYLFKKIIHGCLQIWNFSSRAQLDISLVRCAHS